MRLGPDKIGLFGAILVFALSFLTQTLFAPAERPGRQAAEAPAVRRPLPAPSEEGVWLDIKPKTGSGSGTAFAVGPGLWLTARHVIDGCRRIGLQTEPRRATRVSGQPLLHPNADMALLTVALPGRPLPVSDREPAVGAVGYHYGYPGGTAGMVVSTMMGSTVLHSRGRYSIDEPALVWAERERRDIAPGSLGGISGGPVLDDSGRLVGSSVAGSPRRGRVYSTVPRTLEEILARAGSPAPPVRTPATVPTMEELETMRAVRKVLCLVEAQPGS